MEAFQRDLANDTVNLVKGWQEMAAGVNKAKEMAMGLSQLTSRVALHSYLVDTDLDLMEEMLLSYTAGEATPRHALRLATRAGLSSTTHFVPSSWALTEARGDRVFSVVFEAYLMQKTGILEAQSAWGHTLVRTGERAYLVHFGTVLDGAHLSTEETRLTGVICEQCALFVHYQAEVYRAAKEGMYTCWTSAGEEVEREAKVNEMVKLPVPLNCSNLAMSLGAARLRIRELNICDNAREPDDYREVSSLLAGGAFAKEVVTAAAGHRELQLKLQADQEMVQSELAALMKSADNDSSLLDTSGMVSFTWLGSLSFLILSILIYVGYRVYRASFAMERVMEVEN